MTAILLFVGVYLLILWEAFAVQTLWSWFLVPQFGFPQIGLAQAYGIALLVSLLTHQAPANLGEDGRDVQVIKWAIVSPAMALLIGWVTKQFV